MARKPRIHYPGALYHVMVRGNNGEKVLLKEMEKDKYLNTIIRYKEKFGFILYAYCIMDNHAHLLVEVSEISLSKIMQGIQQVYTQWYNTKNKRTGHVFQQRYKAQLCDKENYLLELVRYIHNNPLEANIKSGINYKWSSHMDYLEKREENLVDAEQILSIFSYNKNEAIRQYLNFMNQEEYIEYKDISRFQPIKLLEEKDNNRQNDKRNIDDIIKEICLNEGVTIDDLTKKTRVQKISDIRKAIVLVGNEYSDVSNKLLAEMLKLSPSMVTKIISKESKGTDYVKEVIKRWKVE